MSDLAEDSPQSVTIEPVSDDVPHELGRYRLAFEFAAGGMATVYLAREVGQSGMNRVVALKCIHRHLAKRQAFVDMFLDEARVAARINHPNVCSVYDFGQFEGTYYIAMEYLVGETFARVVRRMFHNEGEEKRAPLVVGHVIADACEGLHAAHELRGPDGKPMHVVHRDVSPSNIYICYDGTSRIVDFGIAKAANKLYATRTGEVKGKLAYLAPEQIEQEDVDRRADVWSLGVVLWEALTGKRLFRRSTDAKTILAVVQDPVHPPSMYDEDLPDGLDEVVLKALQRDPEKRYQTARDMGRALRAVFLKRRVVMGAPEVAEWMVELFPEEGQKRLALVEQTLRLESTGVIGRVSASLTGESSKTSGVVSDVKERAQQHEVDTREIGAQKAQELAAGSIGQVERLTKQIPIPDDDEEIETPAKQELVPSALDQFPALEDDPEDGDPTFVAARPSMQEITAFKPPTADPTDQPTRMVQRPRVHESIDSFDSFDVDVASSDDPDTIPPPAGGAEHMPMPVPGPLAGLPDLTGLPDLSVGPTMADEFSSEVTKLVDHDSLDSGDFDAAAWQDPDATIADGSVAQVLAPGYGGAVVDSHMTTLEKSLEFEDSTVDKTPPPTQSLAPFQLPDDLPPVRGDDGKKKKIKLAVLTIAAIALAGCLVWLLTSNQNAPAPVASGPGAETEADTAEDPEALAQAAEAEAAAAAEAAEAEAAAAAEAEAAAAAEAEAAAAAEADAALEVDPDAGAEEAIADAGEAEAPTEAEAESIESETMAPSKRRRMRMYAMMGPTRIEAEPGTVLVVTVGGWADVRTRGRRLGRAPGRFELPPGRHTLQIKPFGMNPVVRRAVRVRSGETSRVSVTVMR